MADLLGREISQPRNQGPSVPRTGRAREVGELLCRSRRRRKHHRNVEAVGKLFCRPHSAYISLYDRDKNVSVVDDNMQVAYRCLRPAPNF